jgi:uncharacterized membrane protein YdjX (TVP38/TMEM64 family)
LPALVAAGIALALLTSPEQWRYWLDLGRQHAGSPWLISLLIVLQVIMFSLALPASSLVWIVAALYPPWLATLILTSGGTLGALGAYFVSHRLGHAWHRLIQQRSLFRLLQRNGDFPTLFALRVMPGFPHSITSYCAGVLRLPLAPFVASAALGFACKMALYSYAIFEAAGAGEAGDLLRPGVVIPLISLVALAVVARLWQARIARHTE